MYEGVTVKKKRSTNRYEGRTGIFPQKLIDHSDCDHLASKQSYSYKSHTRSHNFIIMYTEDKMKNKAKNGERESDEADSQLFCRLKPHWTQERVPLVQGFENLGTFC